MTKENPLIRNCTFKFKCEKRWEGLEVIEDYFDRRYCQDCQKDVHLISSLWGLRIALENDFCIAIPLRETDELWDDLCTIETDTHLLGMVHPETKD